MGFQSGIVAASVLSICLVCSPVFAGDHNTDGRQGYVGVVFGQDAQYGPLIGSAIQSGHLDGKAEIASVSGRTRGRYWQFDTGELSLVAPVIKDATGSKAFVLGAEYSGTGVVERSEVKVGLSAKTDRSANRILLIPIGGAEMRKLEASPSAMGGIELLTRQSLRNIGDVEAAIKAGFLYDGSGRQFQARTGIRRKITGRRWFIAAEAIYDSGVHKKLPGEPDSDSIITFIVRSGRAY